MTRFVDRVEELRSLEQLHAAEGGQLLVLYGRRRVGKTELLRVFCRDKAHVYFQAAQVTDRDNLSQFLREAAHATGDALLAEASFGSWEPPLEHLARGARSKRLVVVLDEFPYLCESNKALPSLLQRFWDQHGARSRLVLILCGSSVSFMAEGVLSERSPLFGRRTAQRELLPLGYRESAEFVAEYSLPDKLRVYGILGGMPMYLAQLDERLSLAENVRRHVLQPQALLYEEPRHLLRGELRDPRTYNSILEAIACGLTRHNEIAQRVDRRAGAISQYLATLEGLRLIGRIVPPTERAPQKRSRGRYFIGDGFLRFWYRFVLPNRSLLEIGEGHRAWKERIAPELDEYVAQTFEEVCREYIRRHSREQLPAQPETEVGPYWHRDAEIDLVCRNADGSYYCGECKWSRRVVGERVLADLKRKAATLPEAWQRGLRYVLFSRRGFSKALQAQADGEKLILVELADLYAAG